MTQDYINIVVCSTHNRQHHLLSCKILLNKCFLFPYAIEQYNCSPFECKFLSNNSFTASPKSKNTLSSKQTNTPLKCLGLSFLSNKFPKWFRNGKGPKYTISRRNKGENGIIWFKGIFCCFSLLVSKILQGEFEFFHMMMHAFFPKTREWELPSESIAM